MRLPTSFPGSLILPPGTSEERGLSSLAPGGKMKDPGNEFVRLHTFYSSNTSTVELRKIILLYNVWQRRS